MVDGPVSVGASATELTWTSRLAVVDAVGPVDPSCEVATTVRVKSASEFAGGVILRAARFQLRMLKELLPASATTWFVPSDNVAPIGTALTTRLDRCSEPSI